MFAALAFAYLFAVHSIVTAIAACCPSLANDLDFDPALAAPICAHADDGASSTSHHQAPAPIRHHPCSLCAAKAGCDGRGGGVVSIAPDPWPPIAAAVVETVAADVSAAPHPQSGHASSWSPRAPPFFNA
jgi:hypothetical protein